MSLGCSIRQTHVPKHVSTCIYRPNELFFSQAAEQVVSTCPWYTVGSKMSDKNRKQRINIKFCVKTGRSASETSALLTLDYGEYAMKKLNVFE
jgi:hypothetical protein